MKPMQILAWSVALLVVVICVVLLANNKDQIAKLAPKKESFAEDITRKNNDGDTPLHLAAWYGNLDRVKELLNKSADVRVKNLNGKTPLHYAVQQGHLEIVQLLVFQGADVNAKDNFGDTPLHMAAYYNMTDEIARFLVSKSANVNVKNDRICSDDGSKGWTPSGCINSHDSKAVGDYLSSLK